MSQDDCNCKLDVSALHSEIYDLDNCLSDLKKTQKVFLHALTVDDIDLKIILFDVVRQWFDCDIELIESGVNTLKKISSYDDD